MRLLLTAAAAGWLAAQAAAPPEPALRAGTVIERRFEQPAPHTYRVELAAQDFLHVVVEQHALDVGLRLTDSSGAVLAQSDSMNGDFGIERIAVVAAAAGAYVLEVRPPPQSSGGSYTLAVRALHPATAADVQREAAERLFRDAETA